MKLVMAGVASLFCVSACGSRVVVADEGSDGSGLGSSGAPSVAGAPSAAGAPSVAGAPSAAGASNGSLDPTSAPDCSASPAAYEDYSSAEELNQLLIGQWRRCLAPQIPGEDIGVEFTANGKFYPLTTDEAQRVVRRTGVDYERTWIYSPPGSEDPISHEPSKQGFMQLNGVYTSVPQFTNDPRQLRILLSPVLGKYVPLLP